MALSPFAPYSNSTLRFQVASGALVPNKHGDLRPGKAIIEVQALLEQSGDAKREARPGVDDTQIRVEGFITQIGADPNGSLILPSVVTPDSPCEILWQNRAGQFKLEFLARDPYVAAVGLDIVEEIRGVFIPGSFVVSGEPWTPASETNASTNQYSDPIVASGALSALRLVIVNESGQLAYADAATVSHAFRLVGLLPSAVVLGESIAVLTDGLISDSGWNWTLGSPIFVGSNGTLTQTPPETGFLQQVAVPVSATQIDFEIQEPILL